MAFVPCAFHSVALFPLWQGVPSTRWLFFPCGKGCLPLGGSFSLVARGVFHSVALFPLWQVSLFLGGLLPSLAAWTGAFGVNKGIGSIAANKRSQELSGGPLRQRGPAPSRLHIVQSAPSGTPLGASDSSCMRPEPKRECVTKVGLVIDSHAGVLAH